MNKLDGEQISVYILGVSLLISCFISWFFVPIRQQFFVVLLNYVIAVAISTILLILVPLAVMAFYDILIREQSKKTRVIREVIAVVIVISISLFIRIELIG